MFQVDGFWYKLIENLLLAFAITHNICARFDPHATARLWRENIFLPHLWGQTNPMDAIIQERFDALAADYERRGIITPGIRSLIYTLACVEIEEEELQNYVRKNGTTYETTGHNGQLYSKQRPEWQQLRDNRQRKTAIVKSLEAKMNQEMEEDELDKFLE